MGRLAVCSWRRNTIIIFISFKPNLPGQPAAQELVGKEGGKAKLQISLEVLRLQIREISQDSGAALTSGIKFKDVLRADSHPSDAGLATALLWVMGDTAAR